MREGEHFLRRRNAVEDLADAVLEERQHAVEARSLADLRKRLALEDHLADRRGHFHELEQALSAAEPRIAAIPAPHAAHDFLAADVFGLDPERPEGGHVRIRID